MQIFLSMWGILVYTAKRIFAQKGLTLAILLGITTATALTMSIPIYADAAYQKILEQDVITAEDEQAPSSTEPTDAQIRVASPFSFMFRYIGSWNGLVPWENVQPVDTYLTGHAIQDLGVPLKSLARYFRTDYFPFVSGTEGAYSGSEYRPLAWLSLAYLSNWTDYISIIEGEKPQNLQSSSDSPLDVWASEDLATEIGLQAGETYRLLATFDDEQFKAEIPVRVAGIWKVNDPEDPYWFYKPSELRYVLLTNEDDFKANGLAPLNGEIDLALWYLQMDNSSVKSHQVPALLHRIANTRLGLVFTCQTLASLSHPKNGFAIINVHQAP